MLIGYLRVSSDSDRQTTALQRDALLEAGVDTRHLFEDRASGIKDQRSGLAKMMDFVQPGDVLIVWKFDRLGRSLTHLLKIINHLKEKQVAFRSLTDNQEKLEAITIALNTGMSKSAVCRNFGVKRTTLIETLARINGLTPRKTA